MREIGAGDKVLVTDGQAARELTAAGLRTAGVVERVLDPLLGGVEGDRVLRVRFDGQVRDLARRQVRRIGGGRP